jgi:uncharacterized membrane protein YeaQ/YmgE (transglycosylase-associated protein family)
VLATNIGIGTVLGIMLVGFVTGALARLAVPGPDPMPVWLTVAIGLVGSLGGGGIAYLAGSRNAFVINTAGFLMAVALVVLYRRFVQKRPVLGPGALRFPERGIGVADARERLRKVGVDPDRVVGPFEVARPDPKDVHLAQLRELHEAGVLTDEEYEEKRRQLEGDE